uniref:Uncharacterized protein n=1 Tax=Chromera velia CCMP2878 TaxID=1169474 RepID=A0A0G4GGE6_9ALVE|eukprot:Cvel_21712.t1-p1 / transcript=Cvel_21712.t1 / gene=Cvel_21712 / organism=Chromera_velia_CCMP2878 / gene_product=hypothetical protein / transcript_product=hypothetical protein / location=Cvel_scaffold2060:13172-16303(-) / protein_length=1044 / sequence_SO=supercontig / SO=protein_coding / is_pseudo=false
MRTNNSCTWRLCSVAYVRRLIPCKVSERPYRQLQNGNPGLLAGPWWSIPSACQSGASRYCGTLPRNVDMNKCVARAADNLLGAECGRQNTIIRKERGTERPSQESPVKHPRKVGKREILDRSSRVTFHRCFNVERSAIVLLRESFRPFRDFPGLEEPSVPLSPFARADLAVRPAGCTEDLWLGVQVKSTRVESRGREMKRNPISVPPSDRRGASRFWEFFGVCGYHGMPLVCVEMAKMSESRPDAGVWTFHEACFEGLKGKGTLRITEGGKYDKKETRCSFEHTSSCRAHIGKALLLAWSGARAGIGPYQLQSLEALQTQLSPTHLAEWTMLQKCRELFGHVPGGVEMREAACPSFPHDIELRPSQSGDVTWQRIQLKSSSWDDSRLGYVRLRKKRASETFPYNEDDFDFLLVSQPQNQRFPTETNFQNKNERWRFFYFIPVQELVDFGIVSSDKHQKKGVKSLRLDFQLNRSVKVQDRPSHLLRWRLDMSSPAAAGRRFAQILSGGGMRGFATLHPPHSEARNFGEPEGKLEKRQNSVPTETLTMGAQTSTSVERDEVSLPYDCLLPPTEGVRDFEIDICDRQRQPPHALSKPERYPQSLCHNRQIDLRSQLPQRSLAKMADFDCPRKNVEAPVSSAKSQYPRDHRLGIEKDALNLIRRNIHPTEAFEGLEEPHTPLPPFAKSDMAVRPVGCREDLWLPVQVKSTAKKAKWPHEKGWSPVWEFHGVCGYGGTPLVCISLERDLSGEEVGKKARVWCFSGHVFTDFRPPGKLTITQGGKHDTEETRCSFQHCSSDGGHIGSVLKSMWEEARNGFGPFRLHDLYTLQTQMSPSHLAEWRMLQICLKVFERVPGGMEVREAEWTIASHDIEIRLGACPCHQTQKVQLKCAMWFTQRSSARLGTAFVNSRKVVRGKLNTYCEGDFQFLLVGPPQNGGRLAKNESRQNSKPSLLHSCHPYIYMIPESVLIKEGVVASRAQERNGVMTFCLDFTSTPLEKRASRVSRLLEWRIDLSNPVKAAKQLMKILQQHCSCMGNCRLSVPVKSCN